MFCGVSWLSLDIPWATVVLSPAAEGCNRIKSSDTFYSDGGLAQREKLQLCSIPLCKQGR